MPPEQFGLYIKCSKPLRQKAALQPAGQILPDACFWKKKKKKIYGNTVIPVYLHTVYGWVCPTMADLNATDSCMAATKDHQVCKA